MTCCSAAKPLILRLVEYCCFKVKIRKNMVLITENGIRTFGGYVLINHFRQVIDDKKHYLNIYIKKYIFDLVEIP